MRWLLTSILFLQCATCGQKGPLTLPDRPGAQRDQEPSLLTRQPGDVAPAVRGVPA